MGVPARRSPAGLRRPVFHLPILALLWVTGLSAQIPYDTLPPDSLTRDTINTTARYLKAQADNSVLLPVAPLVGFRGPEPATSRVVLSRDSLDWAMAETVADLLQRVPGVYLWRGGWVGRTEYPDYRSRGPASVEYRLDGMPYLPMGPDSTGIDPSLFSLSLLDRVEIERWPGLLRVHLFTHRHDRKAPRSLVGISSGDKGIARYVGSLERRYPSGLGFGMAGERFVAPTATGTSSDFDNTTVWLQLGYIPSARFGVQGELFRGSPDRKPYLAVNDTLDLPLAGRREDAQLRAFWKSRSDDLGLQVDGIIERTTWRGSGVEDQVRQGGLVVAARSSRIGFSARAFNRSRLTPWDLQADLGGVAPGGLSGSVEAGYQTHDGGRHSRWAGARGGLRLPLGLDLAGSARTGSVVAAPSLAADRGQSFTEWQGTIRWEQPRIGLELGYGRTGGFQAAAYRPFLPTVASVAPAPETDWVTAGWRVAPLGWLTLEGWYSDPVGRRVPDGVPATHSLTMGTIRSKFWRRYRSGIFDFKAQLAYETWGDGILGRDSTGAAVGLDGASFWRTMIEIRLDHFLLYWDRYNLQASRKAYVPRFRLLNFGSTFGVRWEFLN